MQSAPRRKERIIKVDIILPDSLCLNSWPEFTASIRKAFASSQDKVTLVQEILKFLGTVALIATTGLLLLLAG